MELSAHALAANEVAEALATDLEAGLTAAEAAERLAHFGPNRPREQERPAYLRMLLNQLFDPLVALLVAATAVSIAIGDVGEGLAIAAVLVLNAALGFWQEAAAEHAILALSETFTQQATVVRDGEVRELPAEEVVPGDVLLVLEGERVAADGRVVSEHGLEVDESALTGESLPVAKSPDAVAEDAPLAERASMAYAGCAVTRGRGRIVVCATGEQTELGQIERLAAGAKPPPTPLTRRLSRLARQMVIAGVAITAILSVAMVVQGTALHEAFLVGVAVAVAAVPEGLAATVTAALALGARAMAKRGAIVRRLEAIETLGGTTVICTDKTGTLTQNQIRVAALRPAAGVDELDLLGAAVLASSARESSNGSVGDPIEQALLLAGMERGLRQDDLLHGRRLVHELPFDSERKRMTAVYDEQPGGRAYMKGAPEVVAERAEEDAELADAAVGWATEGFRVLAVAARPVDLGAPPADPELGHALLGVIALHDPLRETAAPALATARAAGIEVRMLTGDHPATARTIGHALGLPDEAIVARATPADKLRLVTELQEAGEVVAVTGDGVNDAPALRRADVGVAMGRSGTEAARERGGDRAHRRRLRHDRGRRRGRTAHRRQHPQVRRLPAVGQLRRGAGVHGGRGGRRRRSAGGHPGPAGEPRHRRPARARAGRRPCELPHDDVAPAPRHAPLRPRHLARARRDRHPRRRGDRRRVLRRAGLRRRRRSDDGVRDPGALRAGAGLRDALAARRRVAAAPQLVAALECDRLDGPRGRGGLLAGAPGPARDPLARRGRGGRRRGARARPVRPRRGREGPGARTRAVTTDRRA